MKCCKFIPVYFILFTFIISFKGLAHPPSNIELQFDNETKILQINVTHPVTDVKKHFINKIEVYLDDELMIIQNFKKQKDNKSQEATYLLFDAVVGSKIKVRAICSISGSKTGEIVVEEQKEEG